MKERGQYKCSLCEKTFKTKWNSAKDLFNAGYINAPDVDQESILKHFDVFSRLCHLHQGIN